VRGDYKQFPGIVVAKHGAALLHFSLRLLRRDNSVMSFRT
jgi:hypothetical protein